LALGLAALANQLVDSRHESLVGWKRSYTDERRAEHEAPPHQGRMVAKVAGSSTGPGPFAMRVCGRPGFVTPGVPGTLSELARNCDSGRRPRPPRRRVRRLDPGGCNRERSAGG